MMRVLKFGGTTVANGARFLSVVNILESNLLTAQITTVLSAPATITHHLVLMVQKAINGKKIQLHTQYIENVFKKIIQHLKNNKPSFNDISQTNFLYFQLNQIHILLNDIKKNRNCSDKVNAQIISLGEKFSISITQALLKARNHKIKVINPVKTLLGLGNYLECTIDITESTRRLNNIHIASDHIILMPAFIAIAGNEQGQFMVMGRNGSDYSESVLAACLRANYCEIWKDIDGIYTPDPYHVPDAQLLKYLSYQEDIGLSYFGTQILHPRTILPISPFQIPCLMKNDINPKARGTLISKNSGKNLNPVKGITHLNNIVLFNVSVRGINNRMSIAARVFSAMSRINISIILITQSSSACGISFCVSQHYKMQAYRMLQKEFTTELKNDLLAPLEMIEKLAIISITGDAIRKSPSISAKFFLAFSCANINIIAIAQGACTCSIAVVVKNIDVTIGIRAAHQMLFNTSQVITVFIIGVGGVGESLLNQIYRQQSWLKNKHIDLRICGIANSKKLFTDVNGINLINWKTNFNQASEIFHLKKIIYLKKKYYLINPIIVDCTSSQYIADQYANLIKNGFHIVTPNKKANTSSLKYYKKIRLEAMKYKRKFLYETNVAAGLPVIENLQKLFHAGDSLIKFNGILSGSLSFIFGKLDEGVSLSNATIMARHLGFTEPNPREDLSGMDVARKLLILAREAGYNRELSDIEIEPLLPANLIAISDVNTFMQQLKKIDEYFSLRVTQANNLGKVLRYVGIIENNGV